MLPAIPPPRAPGPYGRPRRATTSARVRYQSVACAVDMLGGSVRAIASQELDNADYRGSDADEHRRLAEALRGQTRRDLDAGRESLWREGVLPWAAWPNGRLPDGDWRPAPGAPGSSHQMEVRGRAQPSVGATSPPRDGRGDLANGPYDAQVRLGPPRGRTVAIRGQPRQPRRGRERGSRLGPVLRGPIRMSWRGG